MTRITKHLANYSDNRSIHIYIYNNENRAEMKQRIFDKCKYKNLERIFQML